MSYNLKKAFVLPIRPQSPEKVALYGESHGEDWQFRFYGPTRTWDFFYQNYQGYYLSNPDVLSGHSTYDRFSNLKNEHFGAQMIWNFNEEDYSLGAAFDQLSMQTESGGAWLGLLSLNQNRFNTDIKLIPDGVPDYYNINYFRQGVFNTIRTGFGGAYTFVYDQFFLSSLFLITWGLQEQTLSYEGSSYPNDELKRFVSSQAGSLRISIGKNGLDHYYGIYLINEINNLVVENAKIGANTLEVQFYYGTRWTLQIPILDRIFD